MHTKYHVRAWDVDNDMKKSKLAKAKENVLDPSKLVLDPSSRLKIYSSGVLQGKQRAHQSFLFLNKQGENKKRKRRNNDKKLFSGDGRKENAPLGKVFHCQCPIPSRDLQRKPFCPLCGEQCSLSRHSS